MPDPRQYQGPHKQAGVCSESDWSLRYLDLRCTTLYSAVDPLLFQAEIFQPYLSKHRVYENSSVPRSDYDEVQFSGPLNLVTAAWCHGHHP